MSKNAYLHVSAGKVEKLILNPDPYSDESKM